MAIHINELNEMFLVQWNARQKQFQVRALGEILKSNLVAALKGQNFGYVPVAIAHTEVEAIQISKLIDTEVEAIQISKLIEANLKNSRAHRGDSLDTLD